jgi:hypothetical protein
LVGEVYRIINLVNDKSYVGITGVGIDNRFKGHLQSKNSTMVLPLAIQKYGSENFIIEKLNKWIKLGRCKYIDKNTFPSGRE